MMGYTDVHYLKLLDILLPGVDLYQEMIVDQAFIRKDFFSKSQLGIKGRLILQLGGSNPNLLSECCEKAAALGYDAVNLNVGCPSSRVVTGKIGAVLLRDIDLVLECIEKMIAAPIDISVKTRIGIDNDPDVLDDLVAGLLSLGCVEFILHARRAWLSGLDPKQNREIPPLNYSRALKLKSDFPEMSIMLNGGLNDLEIWRSYVGKLDGLMLGRLFYSDPILVCKFASSFGWHVRPLDEVVRSYLLYADEMHTLGVKPRWLLRHLVNLFKGFHGAGEIRKKLSEFMVAGDLNKAELLEFAKLGASRLI